jgi:hypothetical protein
MGEVKNWPLLFWFILGFVFSGRVTGFLKLPITRSMDDKRLGTKPSKDIGHRTLAIQNSCSLF